MTNCGNNQHHPCCCNPCCDPSPLLPKVLSSVNKTNISIQQTTTDLLATITTVNPNRFGNVTVQLLTNGNLATDIDVTITLFLDSSTPVLQYTQTIPATTLTTIGHHKEVVSFQGLLQTAGTYTVKATASTTNTITAINVRLTII